MLQVTELVRSQESSCCILVSTPEDSALGSSQAWNLLEERKRNRERERKREERERKGG